MSRKKGRTIGKRITAAILWSEKKSLDLLLQGQAHGYLSKVRMSPKLKLSHADLRAMIRQHGVSMCFIILSANDVGWVHVKRALLV